MTAAANGKWKPPKKYNNYWGAKWCRKHGCDIVTLSKQEQLTSNFFPPAFNQKISCDYLFSYRNQCNQFIHPNEIRLLFPNRFQFLCRATATACTSSLKWNEWMNNLKSFRLANWTEWDHEQKKCGRHGVACTPPESLILFTLFNSTIIFDESESNEWDWIKGNHKQGRRTKYVIASHH